MWWSILPIFTIVRPYLKVVWSSLAHEVIVCNSVWCQCKHAVFDQQTVLPASSLRLIQQLGVSQHIFSHHASPVTIILIWLAFSVIACTVTILLYYYSIFFNCHVVFLTLFSYLLWIRSVLPLGSLKCKTCW